MRRQGGFEMLEGYRVTDKNGPVEVYKRDIPKTAPGRFWMHTEEYFYPREFNIVKVGERRNETEGEEKNGTLVGYDYIVVTDSRRTSLMVFARDPADFRQRHLEDVFEYFKAQCFGHGCFWNQAEKIYQEPDCQWPSEKEILVRRALKKHQQQTKPQAPPQSFLQRTLATAANADPRQPRLQLPKATKSIFSGVDPLQAFQGLLQNLPALSSGFGKKK